MLLHYLHDTYEGEGWGVAWLAPFSFRRLEILPKEKSVFFYIWKIDELEGKNLQLWEWIEKYYLKSIQTQLAL